MIGAGHGGYLF